MEKINKEKQEIEQEYDKIIKSNDGPDKILSSIENLISRDNTNQIILSKYMSLLDNLNNQNFKEKLDDYTFFLSKEDMKLYNIEKESSIQLFISLYEYLEGYNNGMDIDGNIDFFQNLKSINLDEILINNYVSYDNNRELFINSLYKIVILSIYENINNLIINKNEINDNDYRN